MKIGDTKASTRKLRTAYRRMGDREPERGGDAQDTAKSQLTETPKSINQTRIRVGGEGGTPYTRAFGRGKETKANARDPATPDSWHAESRLATRGSGVASPDSRLRTRDSDTGTPGSLSPESRPGLPRSVTAGPSREALTTYVFVVLGNRRVSGYTLAVCGPLQAKGKTGVRCLTWSQGLKFSRGGAFLLREISVFLSDHDSERADSCSI